MKKYSKIKYIKYADHWNEVSSFFANAFANTCHLLVSVVWKHVIGFYQMTFLTVLPTSKVDVV